jgi:glycosyltransferase involved in cell wall biosynthesis
MSLLSFRPGKVGGTETYLRQLVTLLPEVARGERLVLVMDRDVAAGLSSPGWERAIAPISAAAMVAERVLEAYTPWRASALEALFARVAADVLFFPQQSIFPLRVEAPAVITVGDVQHLFFPRNFGLFDRTFRQRAYPRSLARAQHVIAISEFTRRALVERCGVSPARVTAIPHGVEDVDRASIRPSELAAGSYLYYPAASYPHKGHATLFRSYAALRQSGRLSAKLVLTGERTRFWGSHLAPLARRLGIDADVTHLGFVPFAEVRRLYAGAEAIVFPTTFEGFGILVLEAAQLGKRIVTSRLEVFDEIGVPRQSQIDFSDPDALGRALAETGATALGRRPISWGECARRTLDVLRRIASARGAHGSGASPSTSAQ